MNIKHFFDPDTFTLTYVVFDEATKDAIVIDPVLDFDAPSATTSTGSVDSLLAWIDETKLKIHWVLETHAHADHISSAQVLKKRLGAGVAIGQRVVEIQETFKEIFDLPQSFPTDGSQFDRLIADGEVLKAGSLSIEAMATPGHTPACMSFKIKDAVFTGDALFMDDYGTGRADFPRGCATELYHSIHDRLYGLPDETRVFVGHDYQPGGRDLRYETTIGASKQQNPHLKHNTSEAEFVEFRSRRDAQLSPPRLLYPSVQVNIDAGTLPAPQANGRRYLKYPLNLADKSRS